MIDNILGTTFDASVRQQILARQNAMDPYTNRGPEVIGFQNTNAWIRAASSIDVKADITSAEINPKRLEEYKQAAQKIKNRFQVQGDSDLAKRLVLAGGTTTYTGETLQDKGGFLGIRQGDSIWGGGTYGLGGLDFGYKPIPFIESAEASYLNDGALAKMTLKIKCFTPEQLDLLETVYMRLGYTVLVEWGHTNYIDNNNNTISIFDEASITQPFKKLFEGGGITSQDLYAAINTERKNRFYNYDGFYGVVENFSYTFNIDASYDIQINLITQGSVVEGLKANRATDATTSEETAQTTVKRPKASNSFLGKALLDFITAVIPNQDQSTLPAGYKLQYKTLTSGTEPKLQLKTYRLAANPLLEKLVGAKVVVGTEETPFDFYRLEGLPSRVPIDAFISFGTLMKILETNVNLFTTGNKKILRFEHKNNMMFSCPGHFSVDPSTCILWDSQVFKIDYDAATQAEKVVLDYNNANLVYASTIVSQNAYNISEAEKADFQLTENGTDFLKHLDAVGINVDCIINTIEETAEADFSVPVVKFIEAILEKIKLATGAINKFKIHIDESQNKLFVVDLASHVATAADNLAEFASYGIGTGASDATFLRNIAFQTTVTNDFAKQIAIGAQVNANQIGENSTALSNYNLGLVDRINPKKSVFEINTELEEKTETISKWNALADKIKTLLDALYGLPGTTSQLKEEDIQSLAGNTYSEYINYLVGMYSENDNVIAAPFFLPFDINIELLGMSGMKILQRFKIGDRILPFNYRDKTSFIIFDIQHTIQNNTWTTKLRGTAAPILKAPKKYTAATTSTTSNTTSTANNQTIVKPATNSTSLQETEDFFKDVLKILQVPINEGTLTFLKAWRQAEGGGATWNAFNSTFRKPGSTTYNGIGVQNYPSRELGIEASVQTVQLKQYKTLLANLKKVTTVKQAYDLAVSESNGPTNGGLYVWSEGYYAARQQQCEWYKQPGYGKLTAKQVANIKQFNMCPPPTTIKDEYVAKVLKSWLTKVNFTNLIKKPK